MMGAADQAFFDGLRAAHFPPDRNMLAAHITLFHHLPPSSHRELESLFATIATDTRPVSATVAGLLSLGRGTAFRIHSPELLAVRARIADHFGGVLTPQDRASPRLHITVQNKVSSETARALLAELQRNFRPFPLTLPGLAAHHYLGGPWAPAFDRKFRGRRT